MSSIPESVRTYMNRIHSIAPEEVEAREAAFERMITRLAEKYGISEQHMNRRVVDHCFAALQTREARMEEIERRRDSVLAECNPDLPTYEAK